MESTIYAGTNSGKVFRITNSETAWTAFGADLLSSVQTLNSTGNVIYAGTSSLGVHKSTAENADWSANNDGLTNTNVKSLYFVDNSLYAGTFGEGIFAQQLPAS